MSIEKDKIEKILKKLWKEDDGFVSIERISYNKALQDIQYEIDKLEINENSVSTSSKSNQPSKKMPIWKHWKDGIAGNGEGKPIYLTKVGNTYSLTSCLGLECDYIELSELDKLLSEKPTNIANKIEPKFKVGDWVTTEGGFSPIVIKNVDVDNNKYKVRVSSCGIKGFPKIDYIDSLYHLWTIKDAKNGDVLVSDNSVFIFQKEYIAGKPTAYCGIMNGQFIQAQDGCWTNERCYPASEKDFALLIYKMKDEGYRFDFVNKELKPLSKQ